MSELSTFSIVIIVIAILLILSLFSFLFCCKSETECSYNKVVSWRWSWNWDNNNEENNYVEGVISDGNKENPPIAVASRDNRNYSRYNGNRNNDPPPTAVAALFPTAPPVATLVQVANDNKV